MLPYCYSTKCPLKLYLHLTVVKNRQTESPGLEVRILGSFSPCAAIYLVTLDKAQSTCTSISPLAKNPDSTKQKASVY